MINKTMINIILLLTFSIRDFDFSFQIKLLNMVQYQNRFNLSNNFYYSDYFNILTRFFF